MGAWTACAGIMKSLVWGQGHLTYSQCIIHKPLKIISVGRQNAATGWDSDFLIHEHTNQKSLVTGAVPDTYWDCRHDSMNKKALIVYCGLRTVGHKNEQGHFADLQCKHTCVSVSHRVNRGWMILELVIQCGRLLGIVLRNNTNSSNNHLLF